MRTPLFPPAEEDGWCQDWYFRLEDMEQAADAPHSPEAIEVLKALRQGDLFALSGFLKTGAALPSHLRRELVALIDGGPWWSGGRRLTPEKHPDLARLFQGRFSLYWADYRDQEIARFFAQNGGLKNGQHEAAVLTTMERFGLKRSQIEKIWSEHSANLCLAPINLLKDWTVIKWRRRFSCDY